MTSEGYDAFEDPYCYPGTSVLRNLIDIRDQAELDAFEVEISTLRAEEPLPEGEFDPTHYRRIHHHLFQDVYTWAGQYRTVRTSKEGNSFCYPEHIPAQMDALFQKLQGARALTGLGQEAFNGRTQLAFLGLIGETSGHPFHFENLNRETYLPAVIASYFGKLQTLRDELKKLLT